MIDLRRLWIVFFTDGIRIKSHRDIMGPGLIARFLPKGWKHVCMASFYSERGLWVCYDPARPCSYVLLLTGEEFEPVLARMMQKATSILEISSQTERRFSPTWASCTGQAKAMLGIRSWAMTPYQLHQALLARGAKRLDMKWEAGDGQIPADEASVHRQGVAR